MKQLEELLNLPPTEAEPEDDTVEEAPVEVETTAADVERFRGALSDVDEIDAALPSVTGLDLHETEMDNLGNQAEKTFQDLVDLGMNVDTKYSGRIFEVASTMLGHAISAKNSKVDKKLKMIDLQMKKARLDQMKAGDQPAEEGQGQLLDRSELIKMMREENDK